MARPPIPINGDLPTEPDRHPGRPPRPPRPLPPQAPPPAGETPSITSWTRLQPRCGDPEMKQSVAARIHDPLWMLTRQWQVGEFQGEDAGTPVVTQVRAHTAGFSRVHLGELLPNTMVEASKYDSDRMPLEVLLERRSMRQKTNRTRDDARLGSLDCLRLRVDAGLHFLQMLDQQALSKRYRDEFIARYALPMPAAADLEALDAETQRFAATMAGRAVDARLIEAAFRPKRGEAPTLDPALGVVPSDRSEVEQTGERWLAWYDTLFSEPDAKERDSWITERLEYAVHVSGRLSTDPFDEKTLTARQIYDGHLDWPDFDVNAEVNLRHDE